LNGPRCLGPNLRIGFRFNLFEQRHTMFDRGADDLPVGFTQHQPKHLIGIGLGDFGRQAE
jgi:hypothetical protein